jgi:hypothetical protein
MYMCSVSRVSRQESRGKAGQEGIDAVGFSGSLRFSGFFGFRVLQVFSGSGVRTANANL